MLKVKSHEEVEVILLLTVSQSSVSKSKSRYLVLEHFKTDGQSVSMSWYRAPLWDLRPDIASCRNVAVWNLQSCFSDDRTGLQFAVQSLSGQSRGGFTISPRISMHRNALTLHLPSPLPNCWECVLNCLNVHSFAYSQHGCITRWGRSKFVLKK
jgi:hypothetical protein